jgi:hypothetical protein
MKSNPFVLLIAGLLFTGCASNDVNPSRPKSSTGYVDFYAAGGEDLHWEVIDATNNKKLFSEYEPVEGGVLRLALPPGRHTLQVQFRNRVVLESEAKEIELRDGMVTPVRVRMEDAGTINVRERKAQWGDSFSGRRGRVTKISTPESLAFHVFLEPASPVPYQTKAQMPYATGP